jgi:predicted metal-dependent hydrolase
MPIDVKQIIRSKRRTLALIVNPDGSLIVRAPWQTPGRSIREFVEKNAQWIGKKQTQALAARPPNPKKFIPGELFMYLGNAYPLEIVDQQIVPLQLAENFKLAQSAESKAPEVFEQWYRGQARQVLNERVRLYASLHHLPYQGIRVTSARGRWGSCSARGSLNFSWRLILAPIEVVDYVVVHELVHTVFHNHSRQFWARLETILPDYREHKKWLKTDGQQCML